LEIQRNHKLLIIGQFARAIQSIETRSTSAICMISRKARKIYKNTAVHFLQQSCLLPSII